ncbi:hypothetical protein OESDEN_17288 [Oesophagostomum dentatum]|uniref:Tc1-like transposase DDE domain-containing protein n=1 Tax=Oesophagostomum dentatum TaxID=61180 RepID=A0A0B1SHL6_OESDE|nr:hypothetical protein OESDEN_17288 [Oesophagostomum dentatum]
MLSIWWNCKKVIHWELLPASTTVTGDVYYSQLDCIEAALCGKQDKIFFPHENAHPHVAKETQKKLQCFERHILAHPTYSSDLAPTGYPSVSFVAQSFAGEAEKQFYDREQLERCLGDFFIKTQGIL